MMMMVVAMDCAELCYETIAIIIIVFATAQK